jgi:hypothetical protein
MVRFHPRPPTFARAWQAQRELRLASQAKVVAPKRRRREGGPTYSDQDRNIVPDFLDSEKPYSDFPSMMVGLMSVNLATSARTSAIAGSARPACRASDEANWKWAIIA